MKIKTINVIDLSDWDNLVSETYGKIYSFQQQEGCQGRGMVRITIPDEAYEEEEMNDRIPEIINGEEMGVKFDVWLSRDVDAPLNPTDKDMKQCNYYWGEDLKEWCESKRNISMFWERNFYPTIQSVANDLHKKGLIEAGKYSIEIDW